MSLAQQAARGAAWTIVFGLGARAIGLAGTLLMTHLVAPDVIGEVGAATIVVMTFGWITSWGFGQYAIVKGRGDDAAEVTWHCTVAHAVTGTVSMIAVVLLGGFVLDWLSVGHAEHYLPLAAVAIGLRRVYALAETVLARQLRFRAIGISMAVGETAYAVTSVLLAWQGHGGMSVVWGNVVQSVAVGVVLVSAAGLRSWATPTRLSMARFRDMARFGLPLGIEGVAHNASRFGDKLLVARYFGAGPMAQYNMAYNLADIPAIYVGEQIGQVLLPSLAALPPERRPAALERSTALLAMIIFPMAIGLGVVAETLIAAVLSPSWQGVAPLLTLLSILAVFRPITWTLSTYLEVNLQTGRFMLIELAKLAMLLVGIVVLQRWGIRAAAVSVGLAFGLNAVAGIWLVTQAGPEPRPSVRRLVGGMLGPLMACGVMAGTVLAVRAALHDVVDVRLLLPIEIAAGGVAYVLAAFLVARRVADDFLVQLRHVRRRG